MQRLFCITWNNTRSVCFIKSVPVVFAAVSALALQLLEIRNASAASRVISAVVGEQAGSAVGWGCETAPEHQPGWAPVSAVFGELPPHFL